MKRAVKWMCAAAVLGVACAVQAAVEPPSVTSSAIFWLDAAAFSTITTNASGQVTRWNSRVGSNAAASLASGMSYPTFELASYGVPTVDLGAVDSKKTLPSRR